MDEYDALLAQVLEHADADAPRLTLADWYERNGRPERAELIRVQVELANASHTGDLEPLRRREGELLGQLEAEFSQALTEAAQLPAWRYHDGKPVGRRRRTTAHVGYEVRRGFIEILHAAFPRFVDIAQGVFLIAPVRQVIPQNRQPVSCAHMTLSWLREEPGGPFSDHIERGVIPAIIFDRLNGDRLETHPMLYSHPEFYLMTYDGRLRASALTDLSNTCVWYGRNVAGLSTPDRRTRELPPRAQVPPLAVPPTDLADVRNANHGWGYAEPMIEEGFFSCFIVNVEAYAVEGQPDDAGVPDFLILPPGFHEEAESWVTFAGDMNTAIALLQQYGFVEALGPGEE